MSDLPRDPAAERASLAAIYRHGWGAWIEVDGVLVEEAYTDVLHRSVYRCLRHIFDNNQDAKPDIAMLEMAAKATGCDGVLRTPDNVKLLRGISIMPVERENARLLAEQVRKLHVIRTMRSRLLDAAAAYENYTGQESLYQIVGRAEEAVFGYEAELAGDTDDADKFGSQAVELVEHWADHPVQQVGFPTGFPEFDAAIGGGPRPGGVDVIGARSGAGKSMMCDTMAGNIASSGVPCLVIDTETENKDRVSRMVARMTGVGYPVIETGNYRDKRDRDSVVAGASRLRDMPLWYKSVVGRQPDEILSVIRRWVAKNVGHDPVTRKAKPCVVLFDYLKFTDASQLKNLAEYQAIGFLMTKLHAFMSKYGVACVAFVQLNRDGISVEDASAVSQGDRIIWLCTSFSIYKWKPQEDLDVEYTKPKGQPRYTHKMIPAIKSRYGGGLAPNDWIHVATDYFRGEVKEGPLNSKLEDADPSKTPAEGDDGENPKIDFS